MLDYEWALLEKPLDSEYVIVTLIKTESWYFGDNFCSPIVTDFETRKQTPLTTEIQERYGKLQRILSGLDAINYAGKIVEGMEVSILNNNHTMLRGYRRSSSRIKVHT